MKKRLSLIAAFVFVFWTESSWADIDYSCLNACTATGKASATCLNQCTREQPMSESLPNSPGALQTRTDYRCVDLCIQGGKPSSSCMTRCSYSVTPAPSTPAKTLSAHDVLQAPVPAGDTILPTPDKTSKLAASKDYACIRQCVRDGIQYQLCDQNCAGVTPEYETNGQ